MLARAPATSANLGPGFDALGLALATYDQVEARVTGSGLAIEVDGEGADTVGHGEQHLVVRAMRAAFAQLGGQPPGIALRCANVIPHGRGLGSSAAAVVSGLLAARALVPDGDVKLPEAGLLALAVDLEGHPDNVAACLSGGLTVAWRPDSAGHGERAGAADVAGPTHPPAAGLLGLTVAAGVSAVVCIPPFALATSQARQVLPATVPHADAAANAGRAALLIAALTGTGVASPGLLLDATQDFLHQQYRAGVMPGTSDLVARLRRAGLAAVVSGAGPSVLIFMVPGIHQGPEAVDSIARETGIGWKVIPLDIDRRGAIVQPGTLDMHPSDVGRPQRPWHHARESGVPTAGGFLQGRPVLSTTHGPPSRECRGL